MTSTSTTFLVFLVTVLFVGVLMPTRFRWMLLLMASCLFCTYGSITSICPLVVCASLTYWIARSLPATRLCTSRMVLLLVGIIGNVAILFGLKYISALMNLFGQVLPTSSGGQAPFVAVGLYLGLSFYVLQNIAYIIDVYRGDCSPERNLGKYVLFLSFFPKLLAGPIERAGSLLPQLNRALVFKSTDFSYGTKRILWGFFKKIVVADQLALIISPVFDDPSRHNGLSLFLAVSCFSFQIYCDFSGYTDIAIGCARLFGLTLSENFRKPFFATSLLDFWRRWHISLASWLRDYVFFPLGSVKVSTARWAFNLLLVFLLSGIWHGLGWTFLVWAGLEGALCVFGILTKRIRCGLYTRIGIEKFSRTRRWSRVFTTFTLVSLGWIFFRSSNLSSGLVMAKLICVDIWLLARGMFTGAIDMSKFALTWNVPTSQIILCLLLLLLFLIAEKFSWMERYFYPAGSDGIPIKKMLILDTLIVLLLFFGDIGGQDFIYLQF